MIWIVVLLVVGYLLTLALGFAIGWYSAWKVAQAEAERG